MLTLIKKTVEAANKHNINVSICGELASNPLATAILIGLGVKELSVSPTFLPEIKRVVRSMQRVEAERLAKKVISIYDPGVRKDTLLEWLRDHAPDYYTFLCESENSSSVK